MRARGRRWAGDCLSCPPQHGGSSPGAASTTTAQNIALTPREKRKLSDVFILTRGRQEPLHVILCHTMFATKAMVSRFYIYIYIYIYTYIHTYIMLACCYLVHGQFTPRLARHALELFSHLEFLTPRCLVACLHLTMQRVRSAKRGLPPLYGRAVTPSRARTAAWRALV